MPLLTRLADVSIALVAILVTVGGALCALRPSPTPSLPPEAALQQLVERCEADMLRGVCRVQAGPGSPGPIDRVVFVAGAGAIDAGVYRELRDAGAALCSTVHDACQQGWDGVRCKAARALHGVR